MALKQILDTFALNTGYDLTSQRAIMLAQINRAAKELYEFTDLPGCLMEIVVVVPPNNIIALPYFVGELRNMRNNYTYQRIELMEMAPRYSYQPWPQIWNNWRIMTKSPIKQSITAAASPLVFTINNPETEVVTIHVEGRTVDSNRISEDVVFEIGDVSVNAVNSFIEIYSLTKNAVNVQDITVTGQDASAADVVLAVIPNDKLSALYTIADVSALPNFGNNGTNNQYVDVLYKQPLNTLLNDGDTFPCDGFDDAIAYKALEFEAAVKEDGGGEALGWYRKCEQIMNQRTAHTNGATQKQLIMAPNQYLGLYPSYIGNNRTNRRGIIPC